MRIEIDLNIKKKYGFALIEVLVAVTIFSSVIISLYSSITAGILSITTSNKYLTAMTLAKSQMNMFIEDKMPEISLNDEPIGGFEGFTQTRLTGDVELIIFPAKRTDITISWKDQNRIKKYTISYIYSNTQ